MRINKWNSNSKSTFIIAEAGVNHNGDIELAKKLIDAAVDAGADAVKFQVFKTDLSISKGTKKAEYQVKNTNDEVEDQSDMVKKLELSYEQFDELIAYAKQSNIIWFASPFDNDSVQYLANRVPVFKVASGEIINFPLLRDIGKSKLPVIMSRGMANLSEIKQCIDTLTSFGSTDIGLLHCVTNYPTSFESLNLNTIPLLQNIFPNIAVGFSDHSLGISAPIAAVSLGAKIVEKHFTLDKKMKGPDHKASLEPKELTTMVEYIRQVESSLGDPKLDPLEEEFGIAKIARKTIVAKQNLKKGTTLNDSNIIPKRNNAGEISPMDWTKVVGFKINKDIEEDEPITWADLK